jgi:beta-phosphoglucomutase-like phosphatase (HAD superfamily)
VDTLLLKVERAPLGWAFVSASAAATAGDAGETGGADEDRPNWSWRTGTGRDHRGGPAVIFDIDGVLSDAAGRQHFLERGRRDWTSFFEACGDDPVIEEIARLLELLDSSLSVILLTGRPQRVQPQTLAWLKRYGLRWDLLVMRSRGDYAQVTSFKQSVVYDLRAFGFDLRLAFEDDPSNHAMYVAAGVPCVYIHSGYDE